jgi:type IV pilus assembly protein PilA
LKKFSAEFAIPFYGNQKGFTLLELLIMVAILGIIAGTIIPNVTSFVKKGDVTAANAELAQVGVAGQAAATVTSAGQFAAGGYTGGAASQGGGSGAIWTAIQSFVQGSLKGDYYINTDGSVDATTNVPWYPNLTFDVGTKQFK